MRASTTSCTKCDRSAAGRTKLPEGTTEAIVTAVTKIRADEVAFRKARMLIGGKWADSASGEVLEVEDPAHRRPIAEVPRGGAEDVARAVQAAADAFPAWSRTIPRDRGRLLADCRINPL
jgi:delta 1-pyrroline-5-carboxylate dehydrogenase